MDSHQSLLSGRIQHAPADLIRETILRPQFDYELHYLLPFYLSLEKASVEEAYRLGLLTTTESSDLITALNAITEEKLLNHATQSMTDISFAIERAVTELLQKDIPSWHVDKSRNDFQACAQRMFARQQVIESITLLQSLSAVVTARAIQTTDIPMLAYTHYQSAQVISPAFYLVAVNEALLLALRRLLPTYDALNHCPLGAGAIAGLEFPWDRQRMAERLGFTAPVRSALTSVADRSWLIEISFEYALIGTAISRFCTDFMAWGSSEYGLIDLPDELVSISSAMPQKRNFTIFERIRGETAHLTSLHFDFFLGQRNTPYTNLVEVSKEAGRYLLPVFQHINRVLQVFTLAIEQLQFRPDRMKQACDRDFHAGFALANLLTQQDRLPYRTAQIIAGEFISLTIQKQLFPAQFHIADLYTVAKIHGYTLSVNQDQLKQLFQAEASLHGKHSAGSTHPDQVRLMLSEQQQEYELISASWTERKEAVEKAMSK